MAAAALAPVTTIPYRPHAWQRGLHAGVRFNRHDRRAAAKRFGFWVCHRRFGKTVALVNHLIRAALTFPASDGRFAYIAPLRNQAKMNVWDYFKQFLAPVAGAEFNESELRITLPNGCRIWLMGADNPDALRGSYLDLAALDEFGQMYRRIWGEIIRPMLADREGGAIISGTPKGKNAFYDLHQLVAEDAEWAVSRLPISRTLGTPGLPISREELGKVLAEVARGIMSQEEYDQEFECSWAAAMRGSFFARLLQAADDEGRIRAVPWDPKYPVTTSWDLGMSDATCIWFFQALLSEVRVLRGMRFQGLGLDAIAKALRELPYVYAEHLLPHDVQVRELGTGRTRYEVLASLGIIARVMPRLSAREDGEEDERIQATRQMLPRCWFDRDLTAEGREGLVAYRRAENSRGELGTRPLHDWASDWADSFGLAGQGLFASPLRPRQFPQVNRRLAAPS